MRNAHPQIFCAFCCSTPQALVLQPYCHAFISTCAETTLFAVQPLTQHPNSCRTPLLQNACPLLPCGSEFHKQAFLCLSVFVSYRFSPARPPRVHRFSSMLIPEGYFRQQRTIEKQLLITSSIFEIRLDPVNCSVFSVAVINTKPCKKAVKA